ncbi:Protoheme IX farnesyltransferase, mitochondrial [Chionoecetes opilio]|uniref:Protoheme IX farnesyltransferase, mitochondrial n=1 Tax=Chionoecetes opilio TaxID=41210 RepID=A0A8J4Y1J4_CHIOP|nr:Protoheme IX farnesyltransferase, mitochondrial [Chionoecetes opilio]
MVMVIRGGSHMKVLRSMEAPVVHHAQARRVVDMGQHKQHTGDTPHCGLAAGVQEISPQRHSHTGLVVVTAVAGYAMAPAPLELLTLLLSALGTAPRPAPQTPSHQPLTRHQLCPGVWRGGGRHAVLVAKGPSAALGAVNLVLYTSVYTSMKRLTILNHPGSCGGCHSPTDRLGCCVGGMRAGAWLMTCPPLCLAATPLQLPPLEPEARLFPGRLSCDGRHRSRVWRATAWGALVYGCRPVLAGGHSLARVGLGMLAPYWTSPPGPLPLTPFLATVTWSTQASRISTVEYKV